MDKEKVAFLAGAYLVQLAEALPGTDVVPTRNQNARTYFERICHLCWMCLQIPAFLESNRIEKAMRWLGFIQGSMWVMGIRTVEEMKRDNMPSDESFDTERV
jgi:hypothetical protein